jgi:hypothetical protein
MTETPAGLIREHNMVDDFMTAESKKFSESMKPHRDRLAQIESQLLDMLNQLNAGKSDGKRASISTEHGTAYLSTIMTPKVLDKEKYLDWVLENWNAVGGMLQVGAPQKDAVREYMDANEGHEPPFVKIENFTKLNVRRS